MAFTLPARSSSLLLPSSFSTALSKSNSTSAASVTFSATGAGLAAGFAAGLAAAGGGGGGAAGSQAAFGIRSLSHSQTARDGVQWPARQHWPEAFLQIKP